MEYGLAKKLKDAGFPQELDKPVWDEVDGLVTSDTHSLIPTLSELIEACGDEFNSLTKRANFWICNDCECNMGSDGEITRGATPEEAVANLWLELNKN